MIQTLVKFARGLKELLDIERNHCLSLAELKALQDAKLRDLCRHAYDRVKYYRRVFDEAGLKPDDISSTEDLVRIPITQKRDLRSLPTRTVTASDTPLSLCQKKMTSGSTGTPLNVYRDPVSILKFYWLTLRGLRWAGFQVGDRILSMGPTFYPPYGLARHMLLVSAKRTSPLKEPEKLVADINSFRPDILHCYPSVFKSILAHVKAGKGRLHRPRIIVCSAEFLDRHTRETIADFFGVEPFEFYGSAELGRIGSDCPQRNGVHLYSDFIIEEFIPASRYPEDHACRLVLTGLNSLAMPFIRYDQGDLVRPVDEPCPCGLPFPKIELLEARPGDVVRLPSGESISALHLTSACFKLPGVHQFKIIQASIDSLVVQLVVGPGFSVRKARAALDQVESLLPGITLTMQTVSRIKRDSSGKLRQFQSKLGAGR